MTWKSPPNLLSLLLVAVIGANYFATFADLDFGWQIRTGERIVQTGSLRLVDEFSYTIAGKQIEDFEWLWEVTLYGIWNTFGYGGLKFLRVVLISMPLILVGLRLRREGVRWHGIALALVLAVFVLAPAWNLRPMYCTTISLLLTWGALHEHCTGRRPLPWWLPLVTLLWGNLHPGVIVGQALLVGAISWEWLNHWLKWNSPLARAALQRLTSLGGLALLATLLSPDPIERLLYPFKPELAHPIFRIFVEMQPLYTFIARPPFAFALVYVLAGLVALSIALRFRAYRLWEVALLAGLALLANMAVRSLQDWLVIMLALGVPHLVAILREVALRDRGRMWVRGLLKADASWKRMTLSPWLRLQPQWPLAVLAGLLVVSLIPPLSRRMPRQDSGEWPVAAVSYIEGQGLTGRFFAPPDFGAYLTWRLGPKVKTYTDTRGFFFPPVLIEDAHYIPQQAFDWRERLHRVLDQYGTEYFLLESIGARGGLWRAIQPHIDRPLFQDDRTVLLTAAQVREGVAKLDQQHASMK